MKKGGFLTFLIIFLALTAFLAGYVMVQRGTDSGSKTGTILDKFDEQSATKKETAGTEDAKPVLLTAKRTVSAVNSLNDGSVTYYEKNTGKLFEVNIKTGTETAVSDRFLPNFLSAIWSPLKKEVVGVFTSGAGLIFKYLNVETDKEVALDPAIHSAAFSPDGNYIVYFKSEEIQGPAEDDPDAIDRGQPGKIVVAQPDGTYPKTIFNTRLENLKVSWPIKDKIAFETALSEIFLLTEDGKLSKLLAYKPELSVNWAPNGGKLVFSALTDDGGVSRPMLWVKEVASDYETLLNLSGVASSCAWSRDSITLFCALPKSPSADDIYVINAGDMSFKLLTSLEISVKNMFLSTLEDYLILTGSDEKLYSVKIPR